METTVAYPIIILLLMLYPLLLFSLLFCLSTYHTVSFLISNSFGSYLNTHVWSLFVWWCFFQMPSSGRMLANDKEGIKIKEVVVASLSPCPGGIKEDHKVHQTEEQFPGPRFRYEQNSRANLHLAMSVPHYFCLQLTVFFFHPVNMQVSQSLLIGYLNFSTCTQLGITYFGTSPQSCLRLRPTTKTTIGSNLAGQVRGSLYEHLVT
jgi:hypothetical protein